MNEASAAASVAVGDPVVPGRVPHAPVVEGLVVIARTEFDGGAERYIERMVRALSAAGHRVCFAGHVPVPGVQDLPSLPLALGPKWRLRTLPAGLLRVVAERRRVRVLAAARPRGWGYNVHFKREQVALTPVLARYGPVFWTEHGTFPAGVFGRLLRPAYRRSARRATAIVCVSDLVRESIERVVGGRCPVVTVTSGVEVPAGRPGTREMERQAARRALGVNAGTVVAVVGRLEAGKRPGLAVRGAMAAGAHVLVAGDGSQRGRLEAGLPAAQVTLLGQVSCPDMVYRAADAVVFTSDGRGEGLPTVLLEAGVRGVPAVVTRDSGFGGLADDGGGVSVEPTVESIADGVCRVKADVDAMSERARVWALQFGLAPWVAALGAAFGLGGVEAAPTSRQAGRT